MANLTLVSFHLCPYVQRAAIVLEERGALYERTYIDLSAKPEWFLAISPLGKVPVLRVSNGARETILFESSVICEYLEETLPGAPLHPVDPLERARHRAWMEFGSSILTDVYGLETTRDADVFEVKRASIAAKFERVEPELSEGPFFGGAHFSIVDAVFAPVFRYFEVFDTYADLGVFAATPKVHAWRGALASRPSVMRAVAGFDYHRLLREFLARHEAHLLTLAA